MNAKKESGKEKERREERERERIGDEKERKRTTQFVHRSFYILSDNKGYE